MIQIIEAMRTEISYLNKKVKTLNQEKDFLIDNFKQSTGFLLDRLKDLESQNNPIDGERPQTANLLGRIQAEKEGRRIGGKIQEVDPQEIKKQRAEQKLGKPMIAGLYGDETVNQDYECPNCKEIIPAAQAMAHTITCYRNSTKCKICGEVILKNKKKDHLDKWRSQDGLFQAIKDNNEEQVSLFFDHGMDVNIQLKQDFKTPMHIAAELGALSVLLALISRGAGVDPQDNQQRTPLVLAIEKNKFACVRSLVELGADLEQQDSYGRTPLLYACKLGSYPIVELLISYKANINAQNKMGDSCMSFAQKSGNQDIIMLLVSYGLSLRPQSSRPMSAKGPLRPPSGKKS